MRNITLLFVVFVAAGCSAYPAASPTAPPDPKWRTMIGPEHQPLTNIPAVGSAKPSKDGLCVTVTNNGTTTFTYYSGGPENVQLFQECEERGEWRLSNWDWCGTGKDYFELAPGQSVDLVVEFWDANKRERMLANFTEKGSPRSSMVVLCSEP